MSDPNVVYSSALSAIFGTLIQQSSNVEEISAMWTDTPVSAYYESYGQALRQDRRYKSPAFGMLYEVYGFAQI
ncbi:hypothetical protein L1987_03636 [Smallanthus sonchifolius]|uniref:Uncharacterized protein n=1 Tax=Smallanthus sonchifolius TaxID=185202 RepID=A0ACB9KB90_9ASTR|nr:hypothetical protein L1987_03636 [Smallanthus sonchifolius]